MSSAPARTEPIRGPLPVRRVAPLRALHWLVLGWRDLVRAPAASLLHGVLAAGFGWIAILAGAYAWWLLPGAFSGFLLVGPILCTGLYELSRLLARGARPGVGAVLHAWRRESRGLVRVGLVLLAVATVWVAISALLFVVFAPGPLRSPLEFLRYAVREQGDLLFLLWAILGGLVAAVVFALTAVSPPLLLGRVVGVRCALLTSARAVGENPVAMGLWGLAIIAAVALSLATAMAGFVLVVPWIGHATWHAYRELVVTDGVPLRYE